MTIKLPAILAALFVVVLVALGCALGAMLMAREEKKSWSVALRASFTTMLATMTALTGMVGVVFAVL